VEHDGAELSLAEQVRWLRWNVVERHVERDEARRELRHLRDLGDRQQSEALRYVAGAFDRLRTRVATVNAVDVLIAHQRRDSASCLCGWAELGLSHAAHQVAMLADAGHLCSSAACDRCGRACVPVERSDDEVRCANCDGWD
jgi:hypothetical protein